MRLNKIELNGFKSFAKKTEIVFNGGVTAVIGPNGSGKSNVSDAIKWVLGEQSARQLRGSKMEDVIFAGTQSRRPVAFCEVTLTFDNSDGKLPTPYTEVAVTRRVYRSGEGEYELNGNACRLKDIMELFRDTGIGKDGYSIVGQGKVDEVLSNKSSDRRAAIEEAAGVMRYRVRKEEAVRKLERTSDNLARLEDIRSELESRLGPLEEQSRTAREYLKLREELKDIEVNLFLYQYDRSRERLENAKQALEALEESRAGSAQLAETLQAECASLEVKIASMDLALTEQQNLLIGLLSGVETHVGEVNLLREKQSGSIKEMERLSAEKEQLECRRVELEEQLNALNVNREAEVAVSELQEEISQKDTELFLMDREISDTEADIEERKNSLMDALNRLADARSGISRFEAMETAIKNRMAELEQQKQDGFGSDDALEAEWEEAVLDLKNLEERRSGLITQMEESKRFRTELEKKRAESVLEQRGLEQETGSMASRLRVLREMAKSREGYFASIRSLLQDAERDKRLSGSLVGVVAELLQVPAEYETAVSMALGSTLQNIVTPTAEDAKYVIEYLRRRDYGRATLLPMDLLRSHPATEKEREQLYGKGVIGIASDLVSCDASIQGVLEYLLGRTVIVKDLDAGIALKQRTGSQFQIATLEGDIIATGGSMSGGSRQKQSFSLLGREREIKELEQGLVKKQKQLTELNALCEKLAQDLLLADVQTEAFRTELHEAELDITRQQEKNDIIARDRERVKAQADHLEEELQRLRDNLGDILTQREENETLQKNIESGNAASREEIVRMQRELSAKRVQREKTAGEITALRIRHTELSKELDAIEKEKTRLVAEKDGVLSGIVLRVRSMEQVKAQADAVAGRLQEMIRSVESEQADAGSQKERQRQLEEERTGYSEHLSELRQRREAALEEERNLSDKAHRQELARERISLEISNMTERIFNDYELTYENAQPYRHEIAVGASGQRVQEIRTQIREMGDINVSSIDDYIAVKERFTALQLQCDDLSNARADLEKLIAELTDSMQRQFLEQFKVIGDNFDKAFGELFGGGHAELRLADKNAPLDCDIDVIAQPPGKKLQLLSLLSGGERALTAIALVFAMLQLKAPAFCLLDEIESALDEANVTRFADYVKSYSDRTQFILITHRKGSMAVCDSLYGVSMEEKGVSKVVSARFSDAQ